MIFLSLAFMTWTLVYGQRPAKYHLRILTFKIGPLYGHPSSDQTAAFGLVGGSKGKVKLAGSMKSKVQGVAGEEGLRW